MPPSSRIDAANWPVPGRRVTCLLLALVCLNAASPTTASAVDLRMAG
jgi:hypothetical protein